MLGTVQTVTEITSSIKVLLESGFSFIAVTGEISNLRTPYSGHQYFTLKDSGSQLKAVLFKNQQRYLTQKVTNGMQVVCRGRISVYEPRGDYQLIVDSVDFDGTGSLQIAYERLKQKLADEGLFDRPKKNLPFLPEKIALITSPHGAAVHDFVTIACNRFPSIPIDIYPVAVQGNNAAGEIIKALTHIHTRGENDLVVICRGGGSIEDLWPFNDESLARAVSQSELPVVSAIGHEIDFTILDFVADYRAPTPTAAAETVVPDSFALSDQVKRFKLVMGTALKRGITNYRQQVAMQTRLLTDPTNRIHNLRMRVDHNQNAFISAYNNLIDKKTQQLKLLTMTLFQNNPEVTIKSYQHTLENTTKRLTTNITLQLERKTNQLARSESILAAVNPKAIMERGFSIMRTKQQKKIITSEKQVSKGDQLEVLLHDGTLECEVK